MKLLIVATRLTPVLIFRRSTSTTVHQLHRTDAGDGGWQNHVIKSTNQCTSCLVDVVVDADVLNAEVQVLCGLLLMAACLSCWLGQRQ